MNSYNSFTGPIFSASGYFDNNAYVFGTKPNTTLTTWGDTSTIPN